MLGESERENHMPHTISDPMPRTLAFIVLWSLFLIPIGCETESPWDTSFREAQTNIDQGNYAFAEGLLLDILPQAEIWGETDKRLAGVLYSLGEIYRRQDQLTKAEPFFWRALPIWAKSVGAEHPEMATTLVGLARVYQARQEYNKAEPLIKQALKIREKAFGVDHPDIAQTLEEYSSLLLLMNREAEAQKLHARRETILAK